MHVGSRFAPAAPVGEAPAVTLDRRRFLGGAAAVAASAAVPVSVRSLAAAAPDPGLAPFLHGVASGDPLPDGVILWTRVAPPGPGAVVTVRWLVASDPQLRRVVRTGTAQARPGRDHTVKVDAGGLRPSTTYYYAFEALGRRSMVGRTRTAPADGVERLRFAVATCAKYDNGYFNAYARIAEADVDAVLHCGDYIYEGATDSEAVSGREPRPATEVRTLAEYRQRYAHYRTDPDLQRLHQQHPMVATWDDHEASNDSWADGAASHDPETEGSWAARKAVAQRVYDEWMPVRLPDPADPARIYRRLGYGALADVVVIDTRLEGRSQQLEGLDGDTVVTDPRVNDPARRMYSAVQRTFVERSLATSRAAWKLVVNQVLVSQLRAVGLPRDVSDALNALGGTGVPTEGVALAADIWDGYAAERARLLGFLRTTPVHDVVVLTGDIHASLANDLSEDPYDPLLPPVAVELVTPSVTSTNFDEMLGVPPRTTSIGIEAAVRTQNPNTKYVELDSNGWLLLDVTGERVQGEWYFVDTLAQRSPGQRLDATWQTVRGSDRLSPGGPATPARADRPAAAPAPRVTDLGSPSPSAPAPDRARPPAGLPATGASATAGVAMVLVAAAALLRRRPRA